MLASPLPILAWLSRLNAEVARRLGLDRTVCRCRCCSTGRDVESPVGSKANAVHVIWHASHAPASRSEVKDQVVQSKSIGDSKKAVTPTGQGRIVAEHEESNE